MRLKKRSETQPESLTLRLHGACVEALDAYTAYYQAVHHQAIDKRTLILEIVSAFVDGDRDFRSWQRSQAEANTNGSGPATARPRSHAAADSTTLGSGLDRDSGETR